MAIMYNSNHFFSFLNITIFVVLILPGPCDIQNLGYDDSMALYWDCNRPDNSFEITYQLIRVGTCDTENTTDISATHIQFAEYQLNNNNDRYNLYLSGGTDLSTYTNATYIFTVQAMYWQPDSGFVLGTRTESINFTTPEHPEGKLYK